MVGAVVLVVGVIALPYPGPGWLIIFTGLAILATEFDWARRLLRYARQRYEQWDEWQRRQRLAVRLAILVLTAAVVLVTLWVVDVFGWFAILVGLDWEWVQSPLA